MLLWEAFMCMNPLPSSTEKRDFGGEVVLILFKLLDGGGRKPILRKRFKNAEEARTHHAVYLPFCFGRIETTKGEFVELLSYLGKVS